MGSMGIAAIVVAGTLVLATHAASAGAKVSVKNSFYEISGKNGAALLAAMDRSGPKHGFLTRAIAQTRYTVSWEIDWARTGDGCKVREANARLAITYTYPRLAGTVSADLKRRWDRFLVGVRKHEEVHGALARKMVIAAEKAVSGFSLRGDRSCGRIKKEVKRRVDAIYARYEAQQVAFDEKEHRDGGPVEGLVAALVKNR